MLGTQIKVARQNAGISVAELAAQISIPIELLVAWESEVQLPRKRDLEMIDRALQTNFQQTTYRNLKYVKQIGEKTSIPKIAFSVAVLLLFDFFMTGFGYQPIYIFMLILFISTFVTLPVFFTECWQINQQSLTRVGYSDNTFVKAVQIFDRRLRPRTEVPFATIDDLEISYTVKKRSSPMDILPDYFQLIIQVGDEKTLIDIDVNLGKQLPETMLHFSSQNVVVKDSQQILKVLDQHENLYEHFHQPVHKQA